MALEYIIFDLDNTLYPRGSGVMEEMGRRIQTWLSHRLDLSWQEASALRRQYLCQYGTTMGGLMAEQDVDVNDYLEFVHDIRIRDYLDPSPALHAMLKEIPLRKALYTNGTSDYGHRVLRALGIADQFERVIGIQEVGLRNKFNRDAYEHMLGLIGTKATSCIMVEDFAPNLGPAKELGMTTVLVGGGVSEDADLVVEDVLGVGPVVDRLLADG